MKYQIKLKILFLALLLSAANLYAQNAYDITHEQDREIATAGANALID